MFTSQDDLGEITAEAEPNSRGISIDDSTPVPSIWFLHFDIAKHDVQSLSAIDIYRHRRIGRTRRIDRSVFAKILGEESIEEPLELQIANRRCFSVRFEFINHAAISVFRRAIESISNDRDAKFDARASLINIYLTLELPEWQISNFLISSTCNSVFLDTRVTFNEIISTEVCVLYRIVNFYLYLAL